GQQRFRIPIEHSFSRHAFETGQPVYCSDVTRDDRWHPHPQARPGREYKTMYSVPIRIGDQTVAVLNAVATRQDAFGFADQVYLLLLGAIINVSWASGLGAAASPGHSAAGA